VLFIADNRPQKNSWVVAELAVMQVNAGQYDAAIANFRIAMSLNPYDCGNDLDFGFSGTLDPNALTHGRIQVRKMLNDRPRMSQYVAETDPLWQWAARNFAGERAGFLVHWDPTSPTEGVDAESYRAFEVRPAVIHLSAANSNNRQVGEELGFEKLWRNAVFELYNLSNTDEFDKVEEAAARGEISKDQYVRQVYAIEHKATERTRSFYVGVFLPMARDKGIRTDPTLWYTNCWGTATQVINRFAKDSKYPWKLYGEQYDLIRSSSLLREPGGAD
jgi:hypothetical protein